MKLIFSLLLLPFCAFADGPAQGPEQGLTQTLMMLAMGGFFFYFILWRPEQKKRKELDAKRAALKVGDKVLAIGIFGTVYKIESNSVILSLYDGAKMEVAKQAITEVLEETKN